MQPRIPEVGERLIVYKVEGVEWPDDVILRGVVTARDEQHGKFRFLPDEPDHSRNGSGGGGGQTAREFSRNEEQDYGWHVDQRYNDEWASENYVIPEDEDRWLLRMTE